MSGNPDEDERLQKLREEKMQELQEQAGQQGGGRDEAAQEAARERAEAQQDALLKQYLTDGARQRLNAVEMSKPEFAEKVKKQVTALAQSGRIQGRIDEDQMKSLLKELQPDSKSFNIRRR
ncbi:DNA-binding protein [Halopelagius fulvigenes]|uniref:DNA-binding protein ACFQEV_02795 n=1 Tax=Halopelagius fulvigenes TaxID=1198324 RepID=A0ABD5TYP3_9EURY